MVKKRIMLCLLCVVVIFSLAGCFMDKNQTCRVQARKYLRSHSDMTERNITRFINKGDIGQEHLIQLAKSKSWNVRIFAAQNRRLPIDHLEKMLEDKSWKIVRACSWNPNFTKPMLEKLLQHKDKRVRGYLASHDGLSIENLISLSKDESPLVRGRAARNPRLPKTEMRRLFLEENRSVNTGLAKNPKVPMDILIALTEDDLPRVRFIIAQNPRLTEKDIRRLFAENKSSYLHLTTKRGLAKNPNTPIDILIELSKDKKEYIRIYALQHPKMKQRGRAAQNPKLSETEMRRLYREGGFWVMTGLAINPKVPMDILMTLSEDGNPLVRRQVASNPSLPEKDMRRLFSEKDRISGKLSAFQMRFHNGTKTGLVKNPNTPLDILIELSKDKERYMRNFALQHPKMKQYLKIQAN
jgi:hypothetical protein